MYDRILYFCDVYSDFGTHKNRVWVSVIGEKGGLSVRVIKHKKTI